MKITLLLCLSLACAGSLCAGPGIAAPQPKPIVVDRGSKWFMVAEASAVAFDISTQARNTAHGYGEADPLVQPFVGNPPSTLRMSLFGAAEVIGVSWFVNRHPRYRWLQVALIGAHTGAGAWNLSRPIGDKK